MTLTYDVLDGHGGSVVGDAELQPGGYRWKEAGTRSSGAPRSR